MLRASCAGGVDQVLVSKRRGRVCGNGGCFPPSFGTLGPPLQAELNSRGSYGGWTGRLDLIDASSASSVLRIESRAQ